VEDERLDSNTKSLMEWIRVDNGKQLLSQAFDSEGIDKRNRNENEMNAKT
jgi:hypothetical protein